MKSIYIILIFILNSSNSLKFKSWTKKSFGRKSKASPETNNEPVDSINTFGKKMKEASKLGKIAFLSSILSFPPKAKADNIKDGLTRVELPDLPYKYTLLEPYISERTLKFHHDKHHAKYVETTLNLVKGTPLQDKDLVSIIRTSFKEKNQGLFNNAAQSWNHAFYWKCMKPNGGGLPTGKLLTLIENSFGTFDKFKEQYAAAANSQFGSGWAWLVKEPNNNLKIVKTTGADSPLTENGAVPLLTMDVWEHAYYLDYQNVRASYVDAFINHLIDWEFVSSRLSTKI